MASEAQICSAALAMLGQTPISSLSQNAPRAEKCNAVFSMLRDAELGSHNWKFATVYVDLSRVDETPDFNYDYSYQLPGDFLKLTQPDDNTIEYRIVGDKLYTNADEIGIEYIKQVTDSGSFSVQFTDLLTARIAKELAWGITNNRLLAVDVAENYNIVRRRATGVDSQQGTPRKLFRNRMNEARK